MKEETVKRPTSELIPLVQGLLNEVSDLPHRNDEKLDALVRRARLVLTRVFGDSTRYVTDLDAVWFYPQAWYEGMPDSERDKAWESGKGKLTNLTKTALEELNLDVMDELRQRQNQSLLSPKPEVPKSPSKRVFVVHGHDNEMKQAVARALEKLGLEPIILHEHPDKGRTVVEKFIDYSDVRFAVVLFSPDDMAYPKDSKPKKATKLS